MGEWKTYRLGDICTLVAGFAFKSKDFGDYPDKVIKIADIQPPIVDMSSLTGIDISQYNCQKLEKYKTQKGDYVLAMTGATIGKLGRIVSKKNAYINQRVLLFKPIDKYIDKNYLYYYLCQNTFFSHIRNHIDSETAQPNISANSIGEFTLTLPPLDEQRRIAGILGSLDDKIELNRRINANLEAQAQALFRSWFVDFEPFRDGPFVDSELGKIPQGWKIGNLLDIAELFDYKRKPLSSREREKMQKIYPYYGATSIMDFVDNYIFDGIYLLMGEDGSVANAHGYPYLQYVFGKFWPNNHAHVMQGKNGYTTEMLHCLLLKKNITSIVTGAVQPKISQANMKKILVPLAPDKICSAFADLISPIYSTRRNSEKEISNLSALRDTLLPKLMAGEISC